MEQAVRDYCKTEVSFRAGRTSGLGCNQQESPLKSKMVLCHTIFLKFDQAERPMSMPLTLINGGNAIDHSATELAKVSKEHDQAAEVTQDTTSLSQSSEVLNSPPFLSQPSTRRDSG